MLMKSEILSIKNKLKRFLENKEILDIIIFGSFIKGSLSPKDIDIAIITDLKSINKFPDNFHVSILSPKDFFINPPTIINTLLREGYSLKNDKSFAEIYKFSNKVIFNYSLTSLKPSDKVRMVNILRGKNKETGMVKNNMGEWLANQVFIVPVGNEHIFEKLFLNFKVKFKKSFILIH